MFFIVLWVHSSSDPALSEFNLVLDHGSNDPLSAQMGSLDAPPRITREPIDGAERGFQPQPFLLLIRLNANSLLHYFTASWLFFQWNFML